MTNPNRQDARAKFCSVGGSFLLFSGLADGLADGDEERNLLLLLLVAAADWARRLFVVVVQQVEILVVQISHVVRLLRAITREAAILDAILMVLLICRF